MTVRKMNAERIKYSHIYVLKAICALFVVMYHVGMYCADMLIPLTCIAVPCFYMITGFFLYDETISKVCARSLRWAKKAFVLALFTNVVYAIFNSLEHVELSLKQTVFIVFQGGIIAPHLWYLSALWEALLLFAFIRKFMPEKIIYTLPFLFSISLLMCSYNFLVPGGFYSGCLYQSFLTVGLPCISVGYLVAKHREKLSRCKHYAYLIAGTLILSFTEEFFLDCNRGTYYLFTIPVSVCILMVCVNSSAPACKWLEKIGEKHSANIYYYHMLVAMMLTSVMQQIPELKWVSAIVVYAGSILFSVLVNTGWRYVHRLVSSRA